MYTFFLWTIEGKFCLNYITSYALHILVVLVWFIVLLDIWLCVFSLKLNKPQVFKPMCRKSVKYSQIQKLKSTNNESCYFDTSLTLYSNINLNNSKMWLVRWLSWHKKVFHNSLIIQCTQLIIILNVNG